MLVRRARCVRSFSSSSSKISGDGALSVVFGGFGFTQRQIVKHEAIYREHGFECLPVLSSIPQLHLRIIVHLTERDSLRLRMRRMLDALLCGLVVT